VNWSNYRNQMEKVICENPDPGKSSTRIDAWKYELISQAILKSVPNKGDGVLFKELTPKVKGLLSTEEQEKIGSIMWYTVSVKLDLEAKGIIVRVPKAKPQRLLRK